MKVLYIHQYFATRRGHTGTRSLEQAMALRRAGMDVTVITSDAQLLPDELPPRDGPVRRGVVAGVPCIAVSVSYRQTMSYLRRVWSFLQFMLWSCRLVLTGPRADLVFATSTPLTVGVPALLGLWARRIPYVFEVRDLWPDVPYQLGVLRSRALYHLLRGFERLVYRNATALVAVNDDVARLVRERGRPGQPVLVVPNACDTDLFRPGRDGSWFRRGHSLGGMVLVVHTGTMGPVNGLDVVLDAAKALSGLDLVRFVLIGGGNQKPRLRARVRDERIANTLILDEMSKEQIADVLATSDIGLMTVAYVPILELNCANKFFDYLASGVPVVLNYAGWQAAILEGHGCGLSAEQGDSEGFTRHVRRLAEDAGLRARMSAAARRVAEAALSRRVVIRPLIEEIQRIAGAAGARPTAVRIVGRSPLATRECGPGGTDGTPRSQRLLPGMRIVVLDGHTLNPGDLSWDALRALGECVVHDRTPPERVVERAAGAAVVLTNKVPLGRAALEALPELRLIAVTATGYNIVDTGAAAARGVVVCNVPEYGTPNVAQHVFALLLELTNGAGHHARTVREGRWAASADWCYWDQPLVELNELTIGIVGYGRIGRAVADIARGFGMRVLATRRRASGGVTEDGVRLVDVDTLFATSDVVSLHCPLTPENARMVNAERLATMKPGAFLINTARGGLVDEPALAAALNAGTIAGAGLDVLTVEPPRDGTPLIGARNCVITPHIAWASRSARQRLLAVTVENLRGFLAGRPQNVVNG